MPRLTATVTTRKSIAPISQRVPTYSMRRAKMVNMRLESAQREQGVRKKAG